MAIDNKSASAVVGARIRQVRREIGLNQTEFARALGVSRSTVSDVEQAIVKIPVDFLFLISEKFGGKSEKASVQWLITGDYRALYLGDRPSESPLNHLLALDSRALRFSIKSLLENATGLSSPEVGAKFFNLLMAQYISRMEELKKLGVDVDDARSQAELECTRISLGISGTDADLEGRGTARKRSGEAGKSPA